MTCKLTPVVGDPLCDFRGPAGSAVTLVVVPSAGGSALFHDAFYAGKSLLTAPSTEICFTPKSGSFDLSVLFTLSPGTTAEMHEKCDGDTVLDDSISPLNNAKIYHVCGSGGALAAAPSAIAAKPAAKKVAPKSAPRKGRG